ncbi:DUF1080 domain-containing protein [Bacteroides sp.]|uniref:3-keto-disaccharide hydrolase n=1 Tax=Bacteroides sp. TaxID=29523 RepID=UPI0026020256|nr:DUF1080 domain-containing protein [Bacteroides sp.]
MKKLGITVLTLFCFGYMQGQDANLSSSNKSNEVQKHQGPSGYAGITPEMSEFYEPVPPVVTPGVILMDGGFTAPSDAIVLFDGKDLSAWENMKGETAKWNVHNGVFTVNKEEGDIRTKQKFNDFQLHIEWQVPTNITGAGQARGNSGIFLQGMYELQILDSYNNSTYTNGMAGSIYKQSRPLANVMRKPGEWNVYDIIYTAPTFKKDGSYRTKPTVTVIQNGIVLQNNTVILGTTEWIGFPQERAHGDGPIILQSHGDPSEPISFRNIWIREL